MQLAYSVTSGRFVGGAPRFISKRVSFSAPTVECGGWYMVASSSVQSIIGFLANARLQ